MSYQCSHAYIPLQPQEHNDNLDHTYSCVFFFLIPIITHYCQCFCECRACWSIPPATFLLFGTIQPHFLTFNFHSTSFNFQFRVAHMLFPLLDGRPHLCVCVCSVTHVWLFVTPQIVAHQASLSMAFPRPEYWSRLLFLTSGILLTQRLNPSLASPALAGRSFTTVNYYILQCLDEILPPEQDLP